MSNTKFTNCITNIVFATKDNDKFPTLKVKVDALKTKNTAFARAKGKVKHVPEGSAA